jgi:hypothetical protein
MHDLETTKTANFHTVSVKTLLSRLYGTKFKGFYEVGSGNRHEIMDETDLGESNHRPSWVGERTPTYKLFWDCELHEKSRREVGLYAFYKAPCRKHNTCCCHGRNLTKCSDCSLF